MLDRQRRVVRGESGRAGSISARDDESRPDRGLAGAGADRGGRRNHRRRPRAGSSTSPCPARSSGSSPGGSGRLDRPAPDGTAAILLLHDLTSMRRAEQLRVDFIANASHELRTPLSSLLGFIETLRGPGRDDAEARDRFLAIMDEQAQRMALLVEDLLSLSRIEMQEHTPPTGVTALDRLLHSTADGLNLRRERT